MILIRREIFLFCLIFITGCTAGSIKNNSPAHSPVEKFKHQIKYGEPVIDKEGLTQYLFININGKWVKFYQHTRGTDLLESPRGDYLIINDYAATKCCYIRVYDIEKQELTDLTLYIKERMRHLSDWCWYNAVGFVNDYDVEFHINTAPSSYEIEVPVAETLDKTSFKLNIKEVLKEIERFTKTSGTYGSKINSKKTDRRERL